MGIRHSNECAVLGDDQIRSQRHARYPHQSYQRTRRLCDSIGADIMDIRKGIGTDRRIGMEFLYAGIGYGGSCFPKDVKALAQVDRSGSTAHVLEAVEQVNKRRNWS